MYVYWVIVSERERERKSGEVKKERERERKKDMFDEPTCMDIHKFICRCVFVCVRVCIYVNISQVIRKWYLLNCICDGLSVIWTTHT